MRIMQVKRHNYFSCENYSPFLGLSLVLNLPYVNVKLIMLNLPYVNERELEIFLKVVKTFFKTRFLEF